ncbi:hypothetical protein [Sphingomonas jatrophae]|uniref:Uncharacterized protein n=1 Tax=Sphingomonas jatrophae TaxID=1166337 RepID=A0A1I6LG63_9SPHN|nr:hypothetical protein [Sphingomonas jatrophae]SFS02407.1 hypothetical protein SAMN05192580_2699 [Sphingomonas jatrophae]
MAVLKAAALGTIAAVAVPTLLADDAGMLSGMLRAGLYRPPLGGAALLVSIPILVTVTALGWLLLRAAEDR